MTDSSVLSYSGVTDLGDGKAYACTTSLNSMGVLAPTLAAPGVSPLELLSSLRGRRRDAARHGL